MLNSSYPTIRVQKILQPLGSNFLASFFQVTTRISFPLSGGLQKRDMKAKIDPTALHPDFKVATVKLSYKKPMGFKTRPRLMTSSETVELINHLYQDFVDHHEEFYAIYLTRNHYVLGVHHISTGGLSSTFVDPKIILQAALLTSAAAIVLIHNHPSGNKRPSECDVRLTRKIQEAAQLHDISIIDHIILTSEGFYSFSDERML